MNQEILGTLTELQRRESNGSSDIDNIDLLSVLKEQLMALMPVCAEDTVVTYKPEQRFSPDTTVSCSVIELECRILQTLENNSDCLLSLHGLASRMNIENTDPAMTLIESLLMKLEKAGQVYVSNKAGLCVPALWYGIADQPLAKSA